MELNTIWFLLISVLFIGFFILEGFDFGVGILLPFLGKNDNQRRQIINTVGPHWDGNEVWLITAGGALFAAFPMWYATLFSGFYLPLFLILIGLVIRGVAFEFRSKDDNPIWRSLWDWAIFAGSLINALLWGVAFTNILRGVPIDANMQYVGGFWNLINWYSLLGGLLTVAAFTLQGALFLNLKTVGGLRDKAGEIARKLWVPVVAIFAVVVGATYFVPDILKKPGVTPGIFPILAMAAVLLTGYFIYRKRSGWAFIVHSLAIALTTAAFFAELFPRVMVSSLNPEWSLTVANSSSSPYALSVMTTVALIFLPVVLISEAYSYWVFRKRITTDPESLHY
ncbi:MAG: cytochrome d ubiquinol oxidase subunit II [Anaerolineaceae bacterium]